MTLYAIDEDDLIHAGDAEPNQIYWCLDCFGPMKKRKGRLKFVHFYHLKTTPTCRLYSKSVDHLIAQMEIQRYFSKGEIQLERPFLKIGRVADCCWEKEKIIFEIQCSMISEHEVETRNRDYQSVGYDVVWLLDDRRYNKRKCRPAELYLRRTSCYYLSIKHTKVYDQFENFSSGNRVRKGKPLPIDLRRVLWAPVREFSEEFPQQILQLKLKRHFYGDRLSRALHFPLAMQAERSLELQFAEKNRNTIGKFFRKYLLGPYIRWLDRQIKWR